jgi:uncharacterized membrane protein YhaH (DUF805 family)
MDQGIIGQVRRFLGGRSRRGEYWLCVAVLVAANILAGLTGLTLFISVALLPVWLVIAGRRLHDFGQTWLWGLIPFMLGFTIGFLTAWARRAGVRMPVDAATLALAGNLVSLVVIVVIGAWPGTPGPNRFGSGRSVGAADEFA